VIRHLALTAGLALAACTDPNAVTAVPPPPPEMSCANLPAYRCAYPACAPLCPSPETLAKIERGEVEVVPEFPPAVPPPWMLNQPIWLPPPLPPTGATIYNSNGLPVGSVQIDY
jgi:hypothetical protein